MNLNTLSEFSIKKNIISNQDSSLGFRILCSFFAQRIHTGNITLIGVAGESQNFGDGTGERVCLKFQNSAAYWKLLLNPDLFLGEAYMNKDITIEEGSLLTFLECILKNVPMYGDFSPPTASVFHLFQSLLKPFQQINTPAIARRNVVHHYDLSGDIYELFLDKVRQYSCAYFSSGKESLEEAQAMKMQHILNKLLVNKNSHVLDIGSGWGGLARFIARKTGAKVTGITLSKEQISYAEKRTKEEGLNDLVSFNLLHQDGVALLHSIGRSTAPTVTNPWIQKYIFPGGYLPALSEVIPHVEKSGLVLTDLEVLRLHYAKTLNEWSKRFAQKRSHAQLIYDERFCRMWEFYLAASEVSFKFCGNMVFHLQLAKSQEAVPLTRNYLYEA